MQNTCFKNYDIKKSPVVGIASKNKKFRSIYEITRKFSKNAIKRGTCLAKYNKGCIT